MEDRKTERLEEFEIVWSKTGFDILQVKWPYSSVFNPVRKSDVQGSKDFEAKEGSLFEWKWEGKNLTLISEKEKIETFCVCVSPFPRSGTEQFPKRTKKKFKEENLPLPETHFRCFDCEVTGARVLYFRCGFGEIAFFKRLVAWWIPDEDTLFEWDLDTQKMTQKIKIKDIESLYYVDGQLACDVLDRKTGKVWAVRNWNSIELGHFRHIHKFGHSLFWRGSREERQVFRITNTNTEFVTSFQGTGHIIDVGGIPLLYEDWSGTISLGKDVDRQSLPFDLHTQWVGKRPLLVHKQMFSFFQREAFCQFSWGPLTVALEKWEWNFIRVFERPLGDFLLLCSKGETLALFCFAARKMLSASLDPPYKRIIADYLPEAELSMVWSIDVPNFDKNLAQFETDQSTLWMWQRDNRPFAMKADLLKGFLEFCAPDPIGKRTVALVDGIPLVQ